MNIVKGAIQKLHNTFFHQNDTPHFRNTVYHLKAYSTHWVPKMTITIDIVQLVQVNEFQYLDQLITDDVRLNVCNINKTENSRLILCRECNINSFLSLEREQIENVMNHDGLSKEIFLVLINFLCMEHLQETLI
ncbi:hypothetical protein GQR58_015396 [Nymphon striatum]|nr:hypothetical protein GQR58_015396 [Nymphon striatum]